MIKKLTIGLVTSSFILGCSFGSAEAAGLTLGIGQGNSYTLYGNPVPNNTRSLTTTHTVSGLSFKAGERIEIVIRNPRHGDKYRYFLRSQATEYEHEFPSVSGWNTDNIKYGFYVPMKAPTGNYSVVLRLPNGTETTIGNVHITAWSSPRQSSENTTDANDYGSGTDTASGYSTHTDTNTYDYGNNYVSNSGYVQKPITASLSAATECLVPGRFLTVYANTSGDGIHSRSLEKDTNADGVYGEVSSWEGGDNATYTIGESPSYRGTVRLRLMVNGVVHATKNIWVDPSCAKK